MTILFNAAPLATALFPKLMETALSREPDFEVMRDGRRDEVYLRRWWLIPRNDECNLYLHSMLADDDEILHDHMYESWSLILTDGLEERFVSAPEKLRDERFPSGFPPAAYQRRVLRAGDVVHRSERMAHQLLVRAPAWTLFATGPRVKPWGFYCPRGWRRWQDYVAINQDPSVAGGHRTTSGRGVGCGEMS
jgi:hypothetical protein